MKTVLVTGGTGFVGGALVRALLRRGDRVTVLSRNPKKARAEVPRAARVAGWTPGKAGAWTDELSVVDAVVHLAGTPVAQRWSSKVKAQIKSSRVDSTRHLVEAIGEQKHKPSVLVSASAIGYYGLKCDQQVDETAEPGSDYLAQVCVDWEAAAREVENHDVRAVQMRIGVVFGPGGGALKSMVPGGMLVGGPIGKGDNITSWVHLDDLVGMLLWAIDNEELSGAVNGTSPFPASAKEVAHTLASVIDRRAFPWFISPLMPALMRPVFGEALDVLTSSQNVFPQRAVDGEFEFSYARLVPALEASLMADD